MKHSLRIRGIGAAVAALLAAATIAPAGAADDFGSRITLSVAPAYVFSTSSDATSPAPPGYSALGYTTDHPSAGQLNLDYGVDFKVDAATHLSYSHSFVDYQLNRILLPGKVSLVTGSITDYTNTVSLSRSLGGGFGAHIDYFDHERSDVTGLCLNQKACPVAGVQTSNPLSINDHGYDFGGSYAFGPNSKIGRIFTATLDLKYMPRPSTPPPGAVLGGLGAWVGTQTLVPYSLTAKIPVGDPTVIPFVNYSNAPFLYHDSAVPEEYRGIVWGLVKVFSPNVTFSYTNLNLQSCLCVARLPNNQNLRLPFGILKVDFHTHL